MLYNTFRTEIFFTDFIAATDNIAESSKNINHGVYSRINGQVYVEMFAISYVQYAQLRVTTNRKMQY